jgi:aminoglycoside phosphotransferase (APT) family kinase protein
MTTPPAVPDPSDPSPAAVVDWLRQHRPQVQPPLEISLITGGRSNLTYLLTDSTGPKWVLRRPPLSGVIASAHDVLREYRIMHALAGTGIPIPSMVAECGDLDVIGAPFFVMDYVDGVVLRDQASAEQELPEPGRANVGDSIIDALAALHRLPPGDVGLGELGKGHGYISRQLSRWELQLERLGVPASAGMHEVLTRLQAGVPEQKEVTIVHGDYRPGNTIVDRDGQVLALLDLGLTGRGAAAVVGSHPRRRLRPPGATDRALRRSDRAFARGFGLLHRIRAVAAGRNHRRSECARSAARLRIRPACRGSQR